MLEVPLALLPTILAVGVVIVMLLVRRSRAEHKYIERQLQELIRLKRMELELLAHRPPSQLCLIEMDCDQDMPEVEAAIRAVIEDISAGPYAPHHIRDLPPQVRRISWDTPHGPVTVTARPRKRRGSRSRSPLSWGLIAMPSIGALGEWATRGTTTVQATVVATSSAALIAITPAVPMPWLQPHPAPTEVSRAHSGPVPGSVATTPVAQTGPAVQADEDEQPEPDETTTPDLTPTPTPTPTGTPTVTVPVPTETATPTPTPEPTTPPASGEEPTPTAAPTTPVPDTTMQPTPTPTPELGLNAPPLMREPHPGKGCCDRHGKSRGRCHHRGR